MLDRTLARESDFEIAGPRVWCTRGRNRGGLSHQNGDHLRLLLVPTCLFLAAGGWAQEPPPGAPTQPAPIGPTEPSDASEQQAPEYGGPAILSRGGMATVARASETINLRPYVTISGVYYDGLGTLSVDQQGRASTVGSFGEEARFGLTGTHSWKRTEIEVDYRGVFRHYSHRAYFDGMDNSLILTLRHEVSRHVKLEFEENASRYSNSFSMPYSMVSYYNPMLYGLTGNELFNSPTSVLMSAFRAIYQRTSRLSFGTGASGFLVRRRPDALMGVTGAQLTGNMAYRLSRYQTIGLEYSYNRFDFTRQVGFSEFHGVAIDYAVRVGPHWEFGLRAGGFRVRSQQVVLVPIDPAVAAIFGLTSGTEIANRTTFAPNLEGHLTRGFRRGSWSASYVRTVMPGNGVYLTSGADRAQTAYSYTGLSKVTLQCRIGYDRLSSLSQTIGRYRSYSGGAGATVRLARALSLIGQVDRRHYDANGSALQRSSFQTNLGLSWSPGERPLAIW